MNMRLEDMRYGQPLFARHLNITFNVSSGIENRSDSFVVVTKQVREFGDAFSLNGFKNERHRDDLTRSGRELQQDRRDEIGVAHSSRVLTKPSGLRELLSVIVIFGPQLKAHEKSVSARRRNQHARRVC
jgi:hypothetical protein